MNGINKKELPKVLFIIGLFAAALMSFQVLSLRINLTESHVSKGIWRAYPAENIKTGDVIMFNINDLYKTNEKLHENRIPFRSKRHIKIVAALQGAYIERSGDKIIVDGRVYSDAFINEEYRKIEYPVTVRENHIWLMANSRNSYDSRYYGDIPVEIVREKDLPIFVMESRKCSHSN